MTYQIKKGDTLASVARLFKTTVASLQMWNPQLPAPNRLMAGASHPMGPLTLADFVGLDTLASIARLFKTTVAALQTWNPRIPGDRIAAGQRLTVYQLTS